MVLAASTRRGGQSLAGLARAEIGRPAGIAAALAILYIIIIALAGLGIVVVKALGGEEVPMKAGHGARLSRGARVDRDELEPGRPARSTKSRPDRPTGSATRPDQTMVFHEPFRLAVPARRVPQGQPRTARGSSCPSRRGGWCPGSSWGTFTIACTIPIALFVGWYMYRLAQGQGRRGLAHRRGRPCWRRRSPGAWIPGSPLEPYFSLSRDWTDLRAGGLRLRRRRCCRSGCCSARATTSRASSRSARSSCWSAGVIVANPEARGPDDQPALRRRAAGPTSTGRSSLMSSSASCAGRSRGSTRWSRRARRRRWSTRRATSG